MTNTSLDEFDRDTLAYLRAARVDEAMVARVEMSFKTAADRDEQSLAAALSDEAMLAELVKRGRLKVEMTP